MATNPVAIDTIPVHVTVEGTTGPCPVYITPRWQLPPLPSIKLTWQLKKQQFLIGDTSSNGRCSMFFHCHVNLGGVILQLERLLIISKSGYPTCPCFSLDDLDWLAFHFSLLDTIPLKQNHYIQWPKCTQKKNNWTKPLQSYPDCRIWLKGQPNQHCLPSNTFTIPFSNHRSTLTHYPKRTGQSPMYRFKNQKQIYTTTKKTSVLLPRYPLLFIAKKILYYIPTRFQPPHNRAIFFINRTFVFNWFCNFASRTSPRGGSNFTARRCDF